MIRTTSMCYCPGWRARPPSELSIIAGDASVSPQEPNSSLVPATLITTNSHLLPPPSKTTLQTQRAHHLAQCVSPHSNAAQKSTTTKYNNKTQQSATMQGSKHTDTTGPITTGSLDGLALAHNGEWQKTATLIISPPAKMGLLLLLLLTNPNFQIKIHNWTSKVRCLIRAFFHCLVISTIQMMLLTSKCCFTF